MVNMSSSIIELLTNYIANYWTRCHTEKKLSVLTSHLNDGKVFILFSCITAMWLSYQKGSITLRLSTKILPTKYLSSWYWWKTVCYPFTLINLSCKKKQKKNILPKSGSALMGLFLEQQTVIASRCVTMTSRSLFLDVDQGEKLQIQKPQTWNLLVPDALLLISPPWYV